MDLTQMQYFVLVAENGTTAKAAAEAMVSQSTISKSILKLERELGLKLFDRQGIHLVLNPTGKEFLQQVRPILTAVRRLPEFVSSRHHVRRQYRINIHAAEGIMADFIHEFLKQEPDSEIIMTDSSWIDDCDLSITPGPPGRAEDSVKLLEEDILVAVPQRFLSQEQRELDLLELSTIPLILPKEGSSLWEMVQKEVLSRPVAPEILAVSASDELLRQLVHRGDGAAFWPEKTWPWPDPKTVILCRLSEINFHWDIYALLPPEKRTGEKNPLLEALVEFCAGLSENRNK